MYFQGESNNFQAHLLTVPRRMNLPEALVTGRAVLAVRGVLMACSMVPGRPDWVPGLTKPVMGRPDWVTGLKKRDNRWIKAQVHFVFKPSSEQYITWQTDWVLHPGLFQGVLVMFQDLKETQIFCINWVFQSEDLKNLETYVQLEQ